MKKIIVYIFTVLFTVPTLVNIAHADTEICTPVEVSDPNNPSYALAHGGRTFYKCNSDADSCSDNTIVMERNRTPKRCIKSKGWVLDEARIKENDSDALKKILLNRHYNMFDHPGHVIAFSYDYVCTSEDPNCILYSFSYDHYKKIKNDLETACRQSGGDPVSKDNEFYCRCKRGQGYYSAEVCNKEEKTENSVNNTESTTTSEAESGKEKSEQEKKPNEAKAALPNVTSEEKTENSVNNAEDTTTNEEESEEEKTENSINNAEDTTTSEEESEEEKTEQEKKRDKANATLEAASIATMGIGTMEIAQALSEKKSDAAAERDMTAYLATMRCEWGRGNNSKLSNENIEIGNGNELIKYVTEYKTLAARLKKTKTALKMTPGIESQEIIDKAESTLYEYTPAQRSSGAYASLANALRDENSEDAEKLAEQKKQTKTRLIAGAAVAGAGLVGSIVGNQLINKDAKESENSETADEDSDQ